jgi:dTDP-4-amino-4,6-dideoxygalactose transaminase
VIVPSLTFVATAHALQWQQIRPVFCDVDPATHCIDPAQVER